MKPTNLYSVVWIDTDGEIGCYRARWEVWERKLFTKTLKCLGYHWVAAQDTDYHGRQFCFSTRKQKLRKRLMKELKRTDFRVHDEPKPSQYAAVHGPRLRLVS